MQVLIDFFSTIGNAIILIFEFIFSFFRDLVYIIKVTGLFLYQIPVYFSWLPSTLISSLVVLFGIVVIYKIMGREG